MRLLFVGDVVGLAAAEWLAGSLEPLRQAYELDLIVVNPDNTAISGPTYLTGSGVDLDVVEMLFAAGADVISPGTHLFDTADATTLLARPGVIRAANLPTDIPGTGAIVLDAAGELVTLVQLADVGGGLLARSTYPRPYESAIEAWDALDLEGSTVVHLVCDSGFNAQRFAHAVDGRATAVLGTLPHTPSLDLEVLPGGTGFVLDVGFTGPNGGIGGFAPDQFIADLRGVDLEDGPPYRLADGALRLGAVIVDVDGGRTRSLARISAADLEALSEDLTMTTGGN